MGIIEFIVIAVVLGLIVWAVWTFTPIPVQFKKLILWVAVGVLVLLLAHALGLIGKDVKIPSLR